MNQLIWVKDIKLLLSKLGPGDIYTKILKYISSDEHFINVIIKLFKKSIQCKMIP